MIQSPCLIMLCTNKTEGECLEKNLFGDKEWRMPYLESVSKGDVAFLLNISKDELLGVFVTEGKAELDIDPNAFGGQFPLQVKVRLLGKLQRISNASQKLEHIVRLKEVNREPYSYKIPVQNTYGPDICERILRLFKNASKVIEDYRMSTYKSIGSIPECKLNDVAGLDKVKEFVYQRIIAPFEDEETAYRLGLKVGGGFLLVGPPGTGKTLIAMAIANEIQAKFIDISPSVIIGYPGEAEKRIENIFASLEKEPRAVLFFDEAEWILGKRDEQGSSVMQRIIPHLLQQLGRIYKQRHKPIIVIAATNKPEMCDPAFLRPGRFDKIFYVGLPDENARKTMIKIFLKNRENTLSEEDIAELSKKLEGYSGADIEAIIEESAYPAFERRKEGKAQITKDDILDAIDKRQRSVASEEIAQIENWLRKRGIG